MNAQKFRAAFGALGKKSRGLGKLPRPILVDRRGFEIICWGDDYWAGSSCRHVILRDVERGLILSERYSSDGDPL